jgi:hypothetical protein
MGSHPANLGLRFVLELVALFALGWWGYSLTDGWLRFVLAGIFPLIGAAVWGTFAVPDDPSRSGDAPIVVSGRVRLAVEFVVFGAAVVGFAAVDRISIAAGFLAALIIHYLLSTDRIGWLLKR